MLSLLGAFVWSFEFDAPSVRQEGDYLIVEGGEPWVAQAGAPSIPAYSEVLLLPPGTRAVSAEFRASEPVILDKGTLRPFAVAKIGEKAKASPNPEFYGARAPLPGKLGELAGTQWFSGQPVALLRLFPVQWNPKTGEVLFYRRVEVKLELEPAEAPTPAPRVVSPLGLRVRRELAKAFANPEDFVLPSAVVEPGPPPEVNSDPKLVPGPVDYVVITTQDLAPGFGKLVFLKNLTGIRAALVTAEWISENYAGADIQEKIRAFVRDAYLNWGTTWVLLGGAASQIPVRYVETGFVSSEESVVPADWYYSCLDGNWNADGDDTYGEAYVDSVDYIPEVLVARAQAENYSQALLFSEKFEQYQFRPGQGVKRVILIGPQLFTDPYDGERLCEGISQLLPGDFEALKFYERLGNVHLDTIFAEVRRGVGIWFSVSHGGMDRLYIGEGIIYPHFDTLTNWDNLLIGNVITCLAGAYDLSGALLNHSVTAPRGGFVAMRAVARNGYATCINFDSVFFRALFDENQVGLAGYDFLSRVKHAPAAEAVSLMRYLYLSYGLLGDPALFAWSDSPYYLEVQGPSTLSVGRQSFTVVVKNRSGFWVPNAWVALYKPGELYERRVTDAQGRAVFSDIYVPSSGPVYLGVFKPGYVPWVDTLQVGASGPWLSVLGVQPDEPGGTAEPGDTFALLYTVKNGGSAEAEGVEARLECPDGFVQVLGSVDSVPRLFPNSSARLRGFLLAIGQPPSEEAYAELRFTFLKNGDTVGYDTAHLAVYSARVERWRWELEVDTVGLLAKFWPGLINRSKADARGLGLQLLTNSGGIQVIGSPSEPLDVPKGSAALSRIPFTLRLASPGALDGATLKLVASNSFLQETITYVIRPVDQWVSWLWGVPDSASITLLWDPPADSQPWGYLVWRSEDSLGPYELVSLEPPRVGGFTDYSVEPYREYYYRVSVIDSFYNQGPLSPPVRLTTYLKAEPGWPQEFPGTGRVSPLVFDLAPDYPGCEIVLASTDPPHRVYAMHFDGTPVSGWPVDVGGECWSDIAGGDIDGDGYGEVVVRTRKPGADSIYVFDHDGRRHPGWPKSFPYVLSRYQWPVLYDLDGDGKLEIIVTFAHAIWVWREDGSGFLRPDGLFFQHPIGEGYAFHGASVGDVDHDGQPEIVALYQCDPYSELWVLEADGGVHPGFPATIPLPDVGAGVAIGDIAPNVYGEEMVFYAYQVDAKQRIYCYALTGDSLWVQTVRLISRTDIVPSLADVDGDQVPEVLVPTQEGVLVIDGNGRVLHGYSYNTGKAAYAMISAGDVDGDGWVEYFYANINGTLFGLRRGTPIEGMPIRVGIDNQATPAIGDFDGDGKAELVHSNVNTQLHVFEFYGGSPGNLDWPTVKHDPWRTSWLGTAVEGEGKASVKHLEVYAPSVVKGEGSVILRLPKESQVRLEVYDISGRLVQRAFDGWLPAGVHALRWQPKASGVFVLRLSVDGVDITRKAVRVR